MQKHKREYEKGIVQMMRGKRILVILIVLLAVFVNVPGNVAWADIVYEDGEFKEKTIGKTTDGFEYEIVNEEVTINGYSGDENIHTIEIPSSIKGYPVTTIEKVDFSRCYSLKEVKIPEGVTTIGDGVFSYCWLEFIEIPNSLMTIGESAFYCCHLYSIDIPEGVTNIGHFAFADCVYLQSINVAEDNKKYASENGILYNKDKSELICCPGGVREIEIPEGVTTIGAYAFSKCSNLESVKIPNSVTTIGDSAFLYCESMTDINIPGGVRNIEDDTFYGCSSLTNVRFSEGVTTIGEKVFFSCDSLAGISIPKSVTEIKGEGIGAAGYIYDPNGTRLFDITKGENLPTIYCDEGSYVEQLAKEYGYPISYDTMNINIGNVDSTTNETTQPTMNIYIIILASVIGLCLIGFGILYAVKRKANR